jgi:hypothetical protein
MSLAPSLQVNFDGVGLSDTVLTTTDAAGVAHLHKIKPGSEVVFDITFTGINVDDLKYVFVIEFRDTSSGGAVLITSETGQIEITKHSVGSNPHGAGQSRIRVIIDQLYTARLDNRSGEWGVSVFDSTDGWQDQWVRGAWMTEPRPVKVLKSS